MLNIGMTELLAFGIIALLVLGPEKLPEAARFAGRWYGKIKRMVSNVQATRIAELLAQFISLEKIEIIGTITFLFIILSPKHLYSPPSSSILFLILYYNHFFPCAKLLFSPVLLLFFRNENP